MPSILWDQLIVETWFLSEVQKVDTNEEGTETI